MIEFFTYNYLIVAIGTAVLLLFLILICHKKTIKIYYEDVHKVKIKSQVNRQGVKNGKEKIYYRNGRLNKKAYWKNGLRHGPFTVYWPTRKPYIQGAYKDGILTGEYIVFGKDGKTIIYKETY